MSNTEVFFPAIAKVEQTIKEDGTTKDETVIDSTAALVEELIWFATTIKEYSKVRWFSHRFFLTEGSTTVSFLQVQPLLYKGKKWLI